MATKKSAKKVVKKAVKETVKKGASKAPVQKKSVAKAATKSVAKAAVVKKSVVKKAVAKPVQKTVAAKKAVPKKVVAKVAAPAPVKSVAKAPAQKSDVRTKTITFEIFSPESKDVYVAGTFSDWEMKLMKKSKEGNWTIKLDIPVGEYQYKYVFEGVSWEIDPMAPAISSDQGLNNLIIVK